MMGKYLDIIREVERRQAEQEGGLVVSGVLVVSPNDRSGDQLHQNQPQNPPSRANWLYDKNDKNDKKVVASTLPFAHVLDQLERRCPDYVEAERWRQCVKDAQKFIAAWGDKALALGWTAGELFGLHEPPAKPRPSYSRLSRYDATGLLWLLQGRRAIALTADTAALQNPRTGTVTTYRKHRKPAYGPLGDSLDDFIA
jgi:hypothetical protein